jgi:xanthine dehydrogenase iron-sulfur cluster and FAD-binding subunit A
VATYSLNVNGRTVQVTAEPDTPLLWVLRDALNLLGTKFGCGGGFCGACTVHLDGVPRRACMTPMPSVGAARVTTIEGLSPEGRHPVGVALFHASGSTRLMARSGRRPDQRPARPRHHRDGQHDGMDRHYRRSVFRRRPR